MIEVLKEALADAKRNERHNNVAETRYWLNQYKLIAEQAIAELESQEPAAVYGYCPECGAKGVMRERRPDGNDKCANGHTYQSCKATQPPQSTEQEPWCMKMNGCTAKCEDCPDEPPPTPQRTWVGLTDEEIKTICVENGWDSSWQSMRFAHAIETKLKERNDHSI
jgi:hypothetical protein